MRTIKKTRREKEKEGKNKKRLRKTINKLSPESCQSWAPNRATKVQLPLPRNSRCRVAQLCVLFCCLCSSHLLSLLCPLFSLFPPLCAFVIVSIKPVCLGDGVTRARPRKRQGPKRHTEGVWGKINANQGAQGQGTSLVERMRSLFHRPTPVAGQTGDTPKSTGICISVNMWQKNDEWYFPFSPLVPLSSSNLCVGQFLYIESFGSPSEFRSFLVESAVFA